MRFQLILYSLFLSFLGITQAEIEVKFSVTGGFYETEQAVQLSAEDGSTIFYTLDGTSPNSGSRRYDNEAILTDSIAIIRAVAYKDGKRSQIVTQSYFQNRKHSLPVVSIVTDPAHLWDFSSGIYAKGCCADSIPPYYGANFWKGWERPCNVELYDVNGEACINQMAGVRIFGGFSKMLPQKSLTLVARKKYGKSKFKYPIFKARKTKSYKTFILRNSGGDFRSTQLRDAFMTQLAKPTGIAIQEYEPAVVYLNGRYWGIQNLREKLNEHYLADNFGVDKDNVDLLKHNGSHQHGYTKSYKRLLSFLRKHSLEDQSNVDSLMQFMDIHDFMTYNICEVYSQNQDAGGNIRYFKAREPGAKWRWILFDLDLGLSNAGRTGYKDNTLFEFTTKSNEIWPNPSWSTFIIRSLLVNEDLKHDYINTFCDYLNTIFLPDSAVALLDKMGDRIATEIPFHQKRWGSSVKQWEKHMDRVRTFVKERPKYLKAHLQSRFDLDTLTTIKVVLPDNGCKVKLNSLKIKTDFTGEYFKNVPIQISVATKHDYEFVGWKGRDEVESNIKVLPADGLVLEPIIKHKAPSTLKDSIFINELCFAQIENDSTDDWIELYNASQSTVDLSDWRITKSKFSKGFKIDKASIGPQSYVVLARRKDLLVKKSEKAILGGLDFGLPKKGMQLKLYDQEGLIADEISVDDQFALIDTSFTLGLVHPDSSRVMEKNWLIQQPTLASDNQSYIQIKANELKAQKLKRTVIISIIGGIVLLIGIGLVIRRKKRLSADIE